MQQKHNETKTNLRLQPKIITRISNLQSRNPKILRKQLKLLLKLKKKKFNLLTKLV